MRGSGAFTWFGVALLATLTLLHSGFDTTEGSDHVRTALHWMETGQLGQATRPADIFVLAPDGLFYPVHELGNILWVTPATAAGLAVEAVLGRTTIAGSSMRIAQLIASFLPVLIVTVTALGFWRILEWAFAVPDRERLAASALLVFATILLPYSRALSDVVATAAWIAWGTAFTWRAARREERWAAAAGGACLGAALLTRLPAAVAVLPVMAAALIAARREWRVRLGLIAAVGALPALVALMWFNDVRMGSPFLPAEMHPQYANVHLGQGDWRVGAAGLLFSPGKSLFVFSLSLLLSVTAFPDMWRRHRAEAFAVAATLAGFIAAHSSIQVWMGDWGWGPRYAVFIIPLLWLPGALLFARLPAGSTRRRLAMAVLAVSITAQAIPLIVNWQYQYQWMHAEGRLDGGTPWRADNQLTDAARAVPGNIARTFGMDVPARTPMPGMSPMTQLASTGINVWWLTALRAGAPVWLVLPAVAGLLLIAGTAWRRAIASVRG